LVGLEIYKLENRDIDIIYNKMISPEEVSEKDFFEFMEVLFNGNYRKFAFIAWRYKVRSIFKEF
jgi:hypothetical protein